MAKQDDYMKTALRLPRHLHEELVQAATKNGTSLNAEMINRLSNSFVQVSPVEVEAVLAQAEALQHLSVFQRSMIGRLIGRFDQAVKALATKDYNQDVIRWLGEEAKDFKELADSAGIEYGKPYSLDKKAT